MGLELGLTCIDYRTVRMCLLLSRNKLNYSLFKCSMLCLKSERKKAQACAKVLQSVHRESCLSVFFKKYSVGVSVKS